PGTTMDQVPLVRMPKRLRVFERIADALTHMHKRALYRADLKPKNLIYESGTRVKMIDFGLAWVKGEPKDRVQGTPEYMAPETAKRRAINERTDIYNQGAAMYRLTTLKLPPSMMAAADPLKIAGKMFAATLTPV